MINKILAFLSFLPLLMGCGDDDENGPCVNHRLVYSTVEVIWDTMDYPYGYKYSTEYIYSESILTNIIRSSNGSSSYEEKLSYDNEGRVSKIEKWITNSMDEEILSSSRIYEYGSNGLIKTISFDDGDQIVYEYENGKCIRKIDGNRTYEYDWNGDNISTSSYYLNSESEPRNVSQYAYDNHPSPYYELYQTIYQVYRYQRTTFYQFQNQTIGMQR
ncbi:MAG: hypothetical protein GY816_04680 [Cytophagales bacterium]|nr:hypothetical protein [Cytophagales bacterium]